MCKSSPPPPPDYGAQAKAQSAEVKAQTQEQYQMDLLTALMTAGKIPVMDIADPDARKALFDQFAEMDESQMAAYDLSNPFPGYLSEVGDELIADILAASEAVPDFSTRFESALAETGRLEAIRASGTKVLEQIYNGDLEAAQNDSFAALQDYNSQMKELNLREAADVTANREQVQQSGENLANAVGNVGQDTEGLLGQEKQAAQAGATNVLNASLDGNQNIETATVGAIDSSKQQQLDGTASVADVKTNALADNTDTAIAGLADIANTAKQGLADVQASQSTGVGEVFDANMGAATDVRDVTKEGAQSMEGAELKEAGLMGNQMRRMAMTGRRAAEDAYNQQMKGMRTQGIGQGTGSNMRSAFAQNRANQAQGMFAPMAQADATQLGMESSARLTRAASDADANLNFAFDKGAANTTKTSNLAGINDAFTQGVADTNNQESSGLASVMMADSGQQGEIDVGEAKQTAGILNEAAGATGAANVQQTTADVSANINNAAQNAQIDDEYINKLIEARLQQDRGAVSSEEIRLGNDLRQMGWTDAEISALRTNLGYDLGEAGAEFNNYQDLMNMKLANIGMTANQASLMKFLASQPTDIAMGGMDAVARYSSPYAQRTMAPAHQSYINTAPYMPAASSGGGGSSFLDKFINFSQQYQNI